MADIKVRVGQTNAVKVTSTGLQRGDIAFSVSGGTASVTQLDVSGQSNLDTLNATGIATFKSDTIPGVSGIIIDGTNDQLNVGSGVSITSNSLVVNGAVNFNSSLVAGVSTYVGLATFQNDLFVDGTLTAGLLDGGSF